jgi:hypothetical protein
MRFVSKEKLQPGSIIKIDSLELSAVAKVVHCKQDNAGGQYATGVRFLTLRLQNTRGTFVSETA